PCGDACDVCSGNDVAARAAAAIASQPRERGRRRRPGGVEPAPAVGANGGTADRVADRATDDLFLRLRDLRKRLADARDLPAYVIFHDRTLREMAERRPRTREELLDVPGVGPAKLERYGAAFLEELARDEGA